MPLSPEPETLAALAGATLLALSLAWAAVARRRRRRAVRVLLEMALRDPDAATRRAAVSVATSHGLVRVADLLVAATHAEEDPAVLDAIAEAVARNQWEPTETRTMLELRLWAQRRLEEARTVREATQEAGHHV